MHDIFIEKIFKNGTAERKCYNDGKVRRVHEIKIRISKCMSV